MNKLGTLYGIGVGPGDPELITLKAAAILKAVPIVAVPCASPDGDSLALTTAQEVIQPETQVLKLHFAMVKDEATRQAHRRRAAEQVVDCLNAGKDVAFLTEGDVMLYSTFSYILEYLDNRFHVEIVPGISSVMASAAAAGIPLAINDQRLIVLPATYENLSNLGETLSTFDTIVLLKVHSVIEELIAVLKKAGKLNRAVLVERALSDNCKVISDFEAIKNGQLPYMSQVIVSINQKYVWPEKYWE
jgi:precorrin-2/cobalt-factor-2 C20-methyltransferase